MYTETGGEDFADMMSKGLYYVDKTSYLFPLFITSSVKNPLFIRPRRFGKTLNLSMIKEFCELNYQCPGDKSRQMKLFIDNGRSLAVAGEAFADLRNRVMGEFPVISISFKGVEGTTFRHAVTNFLRNISSVLQKFQFLAKSTVQSDLAKRNLLRIMDFCLTRRSRLNDEDNLDEALDICGSFIATLAEMLFSEYGRQVIVIIDEYDVPLQKAVTAEEPYYDRMHEIIRQISVSTFKQQPDPWLYKGIISGCLKIAHQSVFTDANNIRVYDQHDEPYTGFFGFTDAEAEKLFHDCGLNEQAQSARAWYDGYRFGGRHIFCPWSLMNYCQQASNHQIFKPEPFWTNTSGNDIIGIFTQNSMTSRNQGHLEKLQRLLDGDSLEITLKDFTTWPELAGNVSFDVFMTLMLHTGYVTCAEDSAFAGRIKIRIPNEEVRCAFREKLGQIYSEDNPYWFQQALKLVALLMENQAAAAQALIGSMLRQFVSIRNSGSELYYHGFMMGVLGLAAASNGIALCEESESGDGYTDIVLDNSETRTACILELKRTGDTGNCQKTAAAAAKQIKKRAYSGSFVSRGYTHVYGMGLGFCKKRCEILSLGDLAAEVTS